MDESWHTETRTRLEKSEIYKTLKLKCVTDSYGDHVLSLVDDATYYAFQRTKLIIKHMGEFTLHDGDHLFQVLKIMELLIGSHRDRSDFMEKILGYESIIQRRCGRKTIHCF